MRSSRGAVVIVQQGGFLPRVPMLDGVPMLDAGCKKKKLALVRTKMNINDETLVSLQLPLHQEVSGPPSILEYIRELW